MSDELARERRIEAALAELGDILEKNPQLAERTKDMLSGELPCPALEEPMSNDAALSMRLPNELLERVDALVPVLQRQPEFSVWKISRPQVIRMAINVGLEHLEDRYGQEPTAEGKKPPRKKR